MMQTTRDLLQAALAKQSASAWSRAYNTTPSTFGSAKKTGRLSPILAGNLAIDLGEDPQHWMAIATLESERESSLKRRLHQRLVRPKA